MLLAVILVGLLQGANAPYGAVAHYTASPASSASAASRIGPPPPSRPLLPATFLAHWRSYSVGVNKQNTTLTTQTLAIDAETMTLAFQQTQMSKEVTWIEHSKTKRQLLIEPFFHETVCYNRTLIVLPNLEHATEEQVFQYKLDEVFGNQYRNTTYHGTQRGLQLWTLAITQAMAPRCSVTTTYTYYMKPNCTVCTGRTPTPTNNRVASVVKIVKDVLQTNKDPKGHVTQRRTQIVTDITNYSQPKPAHFLPPSGVKCLDYLPDHLDENHFERAVKALSPSTALRQQNLMSSPTLKGMRDVSDDGEIKSINAMNLTWTAGPNERFRGITLAEARALSGTIVLPGDMSLPRRTHPPNKLGTYQPPATFDARQKWPNCPTIGVVRNQGPNCGGCWAFAATATLEDRMCITNYGASHKAPIHSLCPAALVGTRPRHRAQTAPPPAKPIAKAMTSAPTSPKQGCLSPQFMLDCDHKDAGCSGGFLDSAWDFLLQQGTTTEQCTPYMHCSDPTYENCTRPKAWDGSDPAQACSPNKCTGKASPPMPFLKYKAKSAYAVGHPGDTNGIMNEIMTHGPVEAAFFVFDEFYNYKSGVYLASNASYLTELGRVHAVKLIGWGEESFDCKLAPNKPCCGDGGTCDPTPYWLAVNSWGRTWGLDGLFKIMRGQNECGIETTVAAGLPA